MTVLFWIFFLSPFFFPILSSLSVASPPEDKTTGRHLIADVPFIPQKKAHCGPACLSMVFGYYGVPLPQDSLAEEIYREKFSGSLNLDLLIAARKHGFAAEARSGTLSLLKDCLRRRIPAITLVHSPPEPNAFHYLVVIGYDDEKRELTVHSGRRQNLALGYDDFLRLWSPAGNWMLVVEQKETWP